MTPEITVILPAHNPDPGRLRQALLGLRAQTLPPASWETLLVDNASARFPDAAWLEACAPAGLAVLKEPELGLSAARRRGFLGAAGRIAVLVDDDNVLAPGYLAEVLRVFDAHPRVGAAGGRSSPEFEAEPPAWAREFLPLLALRDLGPAEIISEGLRPPGSAGNRYPAFAPIGAGMALRRPAWTAWLEAPGAAPSDRRGGDLSSAGDNDIVLRAMRSGWEVGYFPGLSLTHLIPTGRLDPGYLERLNRGIQKSWMQVLTRHGANPWVPLSPQGAALRKLKAWAVHRPWASDAARIRWSGACGHFEGRVASPR
jgi:GT2 family glycosyltransferase